MDVRDFDVLVVGGGTAGWLSAAVLVTKLRPRDGARLRIGLCESPQVATIGVGESTLPTLARTFASIGLDEGRWMPETGASFKLGVRFVDWCQPGSGHCQADFWNPVEQIHDRGAVEQWFAQRDRMRFTDACCLTPPLAEQARAPKTAAGRQLNEYAYHVDAIHLAAVLQRESKRRGVVHVVDHVTDVLVGRGPRIEALLTRTSGALRADLVVDCTGFRSLVLGDALDEPWRSFADSLLADRAVAIPTPYDEPDPPSVASHTSAVALSSGWMWRVPLTTREGVGYVYSSRFADPETAERELRQRVGDRASGVEARHLRMRTGHRVRSWVGNCVAIGLASGFVEPLEATGIYFVERALASLLEALAGGGPDAYNDQMRAAYEEVRDLIVMHYLVNDRTDTPFWAATKQVEVPDSLRRRLACWKRRPPRRGDFPAGSVFGVTTWLSVLAGMGFWRDAPPTPRAAGPNLSRSVHTARDRLLREAADHGALLSAMHAAASGTGA